MIGGHVLDDRQPQARAAGGPRTRFVDAVEALENPLLRLLGDSNALVDDGDAHQLIAGRLRRGRL